VWEADAHSMTWAYHHEIEGAIDGTELGYSDGSFRDESWTTTINIGQQIDALFRNDEIRGEDHEARWVIWFDN